MPHVAGENTNGAVATRVGDGAPPARGRLRRALESDLWYSFTRSPVQPSMISARPPANRAPLSW